MPAFLSKSPLILNALGVQHSIQIHIHQIVEILATQVESVQVIIYTISGM